jgi:hypothetical protein
MIIPIEFIMCIAMIESNVKWNAVGDDLQSIGILQMQEAYVQDAAEYANKDWKHMDALDELTAVRIFRAYMDRYCTKERLGREPTLQDVARIHNGGPNGYKKPSTLKFWKKVKERYYE